MLCSATTSLLIYSIVEASTPPEVIPFADNITAIAAEDDFTVTPPMALVIGTTGGSLYLYYFGKYSWFNKAITTLFKG